MKQLKFISIVVVCCSLLSLQSGKKDFQTILSDFKKEYLGLYLRDFSISYVMNLRRIPSPKEVKNQERFFRKYKKLLDQFDSRQLSKDNQVNLDILMYEINLNLERLALAKEWNDNNYEFHENGLYHEPMGKKWYAYFLKKWSDKTITPEYAYQFGLEEIEKVKSSMADIRKEMGMDSISFQRKWESKQYLISDKNIVTDKYRKLRLEVREKARHYFPDVDKIQNVEITESHDESMTIAPAYYNNNTFYYNFFGGNHDSRHMGWLFLHEAVPGHHYQINLANQQNDSILHLFNYPSYTEGWASYIEQYGEELGAYKTPFDVYSQLEWELIRSVRVPLDVGINYHGWSDEQAMIFWNQHIPNQEEIAKREIKRIKRWPAQIISYKYGRHMLDKLKGKKSSPEELKSFHKQVLSYGNIPLSVLQKHINIQL